MEPSRRPSFVRISELLEHLGDIPPVRVRLQPPPGTATEEHLLRILDHEDCIAELIDGTIVEKSLSTEESALAGDLLVHLKTYLRENDLGVATTPDGAFQLEPGQVRSPDVGYIRWEQLPGKAYPSETIASVCPDLAVEILSPSNTPREMERKVADYFNAGARQVWLIDPVRQSAEMHTRGSDPICVDESGELDGGTVLPGFSLPLQELFAGED